VASVGGGADVALASPKVTLNWRTGEMMIRATLTRPPGPVRDSVWVWAYFVTPNHDDRASWSNAPIGLAWPFRGGDTATVMARGQFHWVTNRDTPREGHVARVSGSSISSDAAQVPSPARAYDVRGATRVVGSM
jgi:hypothetical protein